MRMQRTAVLVATRRVCTLRFWESAPTRAARERTSEFHELEATRKGVLIFCLLMRVLIGVSHLLRGFGDGVSVAVGLQYLN